MSCAYVVCCDYALQLFAVALQFAKRSLLGPESTDVTWLSSATLSVIQHLCQKNGWIFVCHRGLHEFLMLLQLIFYFNLVFTISEVGFTTNNDKVYSP